jgi:Family of unknown function (DUF5335)
MNAATQQHNWTQFLKFYNEQNKGRATRLGVFENENDYWLENGLPLVGIDVDTRGERSAIEIMLGNFTHTIRDARNIKILLSFDGSEDGLDITDCEGRTTILRFE